MNMEKPTNKKDNLLRKDLEYNLAVAKLNPALENGGGEDNSNNLRKY